MSNIFLIVWLHFLGDFIFQTDKMALNKSKSVRWLTIHVLAYSVPFFYFGWRYALLNASLHWTVDFATSRATSWAWKKEKRGLFFKIIGLDQALHLTCLFFTFGIV